jgi:hypothetical protein
MELRPEKHGENPMNILIPLLVIAGMAAFAVLVLGVTMGITGYVIALSTAKFGTSASAPAPAPPPSPVAGPLTFDLSPAKWAALYSQGATPAVVAAPGGGWYFDFPAKGAGDVHYVVSAINLNISALKSVTVSGTITSSGNPAYFPTDPAEGPPCKASVMLQQLGDNLSGVGNYQYYRWFSHITIPLVDGPFRVTIPLTIDQWGPVGGPNNPPPTNTPAQGFAGALANLRNIGVTFGGQFFAGHGVSITQGSARFTCTAFNAT